MNTAKQFWSLFKFQQSVNPFLLCLPLIIVIPYLTTTFLGAGRSSYLSLSYLLSNQNIYFVAIFAVMWLAPEIMRRGNTTVPWTGGTEFILTRAVDRRIVARARLALFYLVILIVPLGAMAYSVGHPSLTVSEYDSGVRQKVLAEVPGSKPVANIDDLHPNTISIPNGELLLSGWRLWSMLACAILVQAAVHLIYPWKFRRALAWSLYALFIFLPLLPIFVTRNPGQLTFIQNWFFTYASHPTLCWLVALVVFLSAQLWSERRFASMEQN
jgi:hypothetical protein